MPASISNVPVRADLLRQLKAANQFVWLSVPGQLVAVGCFVWLIDWHRVEANPLLPTIAIAFMVGPFFLGVMQSWVQKKKEIGDLREDTQFGQYDKYRLQTLFQDTLQRLNLPDEKLPVYITADKFLNAGAMHLGFGGFFKSLNGVYLNRQVLHKLEPEEVQDIMGHELGHYYRHYLLGDRFRAITIALGALLGIYVSQVVGMGSFISLIALSVCATAFWSVSNIQRARHGQTIEYLCDDLGAQVHGIETSINGLMKLGADAELQQAVMQQAMQSGHYENLSPAETVQAIQKAIPYGHVSRDELEQAVEQSLKRQAKQSQQVSMSGFAKYIWNSDVEEEAKEEFDNELRMIAQIQQAPRLNWESLLSDPERLHLTYPQIEQLVEMIESQPSHLLFHIPDEAGSMDGVHPPLKLRILYLWQNHREIEAAQSETHDGW
ncbi:MAG: Zn-dependent protease with chaperone function [Planctomycetaceae bacterium]|jgi:Zn-dependent protease with chaperone function